MNNELIERIDHCLKYDELPTVAVQTLEQCKAALTQQQEAEPLSHASPGELPSPVVFIDGIGAARKSPEECRDGVSYIQHGGRTYWPLSEQDNRCLLRACCGHGEFDGPQAPEVDAR